MKSFALVLVSLFANAAFAASEGQITMSAPKSQASALEKDNTSEAGFHYSSLNDGTPFAVVGGFHEFENGFALGVRGELPVQFSSQQQAYVGQAVARFILLNEQDVIYVDGTLGEGFFNGKDNGDFFSMIGAEVGYQRQINEKFGAGGLLGLDYSDKRLSQNEITVSRTLYSKIGVYGVYYF